MIYDHIRNIALYKGIHLALDIGLDYLMSANKIQVMVLCYLIMA